MNKIESTTDDTFHLVEESKELVVVDFWAEWCAPCKMLLPTLEKLAEEYEGRMTFLKLDVDNNTAVTGKYGVRGIPSLIFFKNGYQETTVGVQSSDELRKVIEKYIA